jgi:hypothetical protein
MRKYISSTTNLWIAYTIWLCLLLGSCAKAPDFKPEPSITFDGFSKSTMLQGQFNDSTFIKIGFIDGDGDFGANTTSNESNIFFKDLRTGVIIPYKAPFIPSQGANNGVTGTITILLRSTCCIYPPTTGIPPCEVVSEYPTNVLSYEIFVKDRAGNESNRITTTPINITCK